ncbi:MAG: hypothetical protein GEV12_13430 [Micromonosporaceae bacterium]|nr:hypothetical protein [Micromonosporaceae bacterium]
MPKDVEAGDPLADRVRAAAGALEPLVARAEAVQRERAVAAGAVAGAAGSAAERGAPRWTDVFTTQFTEFSNRPR